MDYESTLAEFRAQLEGVNQLLLVDPTNTEALAVKAELYGVHLALSCS
jgi:hypothetical protein